MKNAKNEARLTSEALRIESERGRPGIYNAWDTCVSAIRRIAGLHGSRADLCVELNHRNEVLDRLRGPGGWSGI